MLGLSVVVSLALGAILRRIGREIGELVETEPWGVSPSSHAEPRAAEAVGQAGTPDRPRR
jgi:hypothetical protein